MAGRGRRGFSRRPRGPRQDFPGSEDLGSCNLDMEGKKIIIEIKSNDQGKFVKIIEMQGQIRGRVIFSLERAFEFRSILNELVAEYERLPPQEEQASESEIIKTESFSQGRRKYYVDLRQNQRGRFLKVTMLAGTKTFVAIPAESLIQFRDSFASLLDEHASEGTSNGPPSSGPRNKPPPQRTREPRSPPPPTTNIGPSREVRAGGKRFYFDVEQNDRGIFIKLSEVLTNGRRNRINIPQTCWSKMNKTFATYMQELPLPSGEEESSGSGSEN